MIMIIGTIASIAMDDAHTQRYATRRRTSPRAHVRTHARARPSMVRTDTALNGAYRHA